jgi:hypothetical protein
MVGNSALLRTARPIHFGTEQTCRDRILMSVSRAKADVTALIEYFWLWTHLGSHSRLQVLPNIRREWPWLIGRSSRFTAISPVSRRELGSSSQYHVLQVLGESVDDTQGLPTSLFASTALVRGRVAVATAAPSAQIVEQGRLRKRSGRQFRRNRLRSPYSATIRQGRRGGNEGQSCNDQ